ncbi:hypothetical protein EV426DRAFT_708345 [Tirmania nivea]|nr:hypothetical protein EV426DRAFT_708345 [Tirmania nivea]
MEQALLLCVLFLRIFMLPDVMQEYHLIQYLTSSLPAASSPTWSDNTKSFWPRWEQPYTAVVADNGRRCKLGEEAQVPMEDLLHPYDPRTSRGMRMDDLASVVIPVKEMLGQQRYSRDHEDQGRGSYPRRIHIYDSSQRSKLVREKQIISEDLEVGGSEEFVVVDRISVTEEMYVCIIEVKRESLGAAMKQCLLSMKDMGNSNNGGAVFGFVTTGESWSMLRCDGTVFQVTEMFDAIFETMRTK